MRLWLVFYNFISQNKFAKHRLTEMQRIVLLSWKTFPLFEKKKKKVKQKVVFFGEKSYIETVVICKLRIYANCLWIMRQIIMTLLILEMCVCFWWNMIFLFTYSFSRVFIYLKLPQILYLHFQTRMYSYIYKTN